MSWKSGGCGARGVIVGRGLSARFVAAIGVGGRGHAAGVATRRDFRRLPTRLETCAQDVRRVQNENTLTAEWHSFVAVVGKHSEEWMCADFDGSQAGGRATGRVFQAQDKSEALKRDAGRWTFLTGVSVCAALFGDQALVSKASLSRYPAVFACF